MLIKREVIKYSMKCFMVYEHKNKFKCIVMEWHLRYT